MTSPERRALLFLSAVAVLGVGSRLARTEAVGPAATVETRRALARQIAAVDSARAAEERRKAERQRGRSGGRGRDAAAERGRARTEEGLGAASPAVPPPASAPVDVDRATAAELEPLPGIGPALAARIVAERERGGAFGSLEGLDRVPGVGPALLRMLRGRVTFSGIPRLEGADAGTSTPASAERRTRRRPRTRVP